VFSDLSCCATYQKQALPGVLSYPLFFTLRSVFQQKQSMNQLQVRRSSCRIQSFPLHKKQLLTSLRGVRDPRAGITAEHILQLPESIC
jgi:hypothetical protein